MIALNTSTRIVVAHQDQAKKVSSQSKNLNQGQQTVALPTAQTPATQAQKTNL